MEQTKSQVVADLKKETPSDVPFSHRPLRDIPCNLCGGVTPQTIYPSTIQPQDIAKFECACTCERHGEYYQLVQCRQCGLYYSSPRPDADMLKACYTSVEDAVYQEEMDGRVKTFQRNLKNISRYKRGGALLDVGCSMGVFLAEAKKAGWDAMGVEPSAWCVQQGRRLLNIDARQGTDDDLKSLGREFDVVTLWDVLEHVDDPLKTLKNCKDVLADDGILVFSTVDIGSVYAKFLGKKWPWLMKMHIYYFNRKSIRKYLDKAGLELLEIRVYKHTVSLNYLLYKLNSINKPLYHLAKFLKEIVFLGKNIYLTIGLGDFMEVYARKR